MKFRLHLLQWMISQAYRAWSAPSSAIYCYCVCEPDLLLVVLLFSTRNYSDAWICMDLKCLLVRKQKKNKKEEQVCSLGFYFLYAQASQLHQLLILLKGRLDDATNIMTWKKLHGLLFWGLKQRGTHAPLAWIWFTDLSFPNLNA